MGKIERGESFVTAATLEKLAQALNVKIEDFFRFDSFVSIDEMKLELCLNNKSDEEIKQLPDLLTIKRLTSLNSRLTHLRLHQHLRRQISRRLLPRQ